MAFGLGAILGTAATVLPSVLGYFASEKSSKRQLDFYREQAIANKQAQAASQANFERNLAEQERFAKNKIRWSAADARAAGLSPLHAMGMGQGFSPVMSGGYQAGPSGSAPSSSENALRHLGQGVSRAARNYMSQEQRAVNDIALENGRLKNDFLRTQIASEQARLRQYENPAVIEMPHRVITPSKSDPSQEPGVVTDKGFANTPSGMHPVPSDDVKQKIEDNWIAEFTWALRNYGRAFGKGTGGPAKKIFNKRFPGAIGYRFDRFKMDFVPLYKDTPSAGLETWPSVDYYRYTNPQYFKRKRR